MKTNEKSYSLKASGNSKIAAALAKLCANGEIGEPLVRSGVSQGAFALFLARLAAKHLAAGKTPEQVADVFTLVSGGNASAARQALAECALEFDGEKAQSVSAFWLKSGGIAAAPNLSILDL